MGDWTVRDLVDHVVGGNRMATVLLAEGTSEESMAVFADSHTDLDPVPRSSTRTRHRGGIRVGGRTRRDRASPDG